MSNIYIQEPPTGGKVLLKTSIGDIDIELWTKEAPKACRNFIQLCMEGYYDGVIFHRVVKGFIAQGGDPTGSGFGGESIYGEPFKDEFHSRIKFNRRGLVAMANAGKDDNSSQFFFTLSATPELQGKHTIFGKVTGKTIYNMIKFDELQVDQNDKPFDPPKIIRTEILSNPFDDILPRDSGRKKKKDQDKINEQQSTATAKKDFKLLSFGDEAEEEEEVVNQVTERGVSKSSHDLTNDPKLSSIPAVEVSSSTTTIESFKRPFEVDRESKKKSKKSRNISLECEEKTPTKLNDELADKDDSKCQEIQSNIKLNQVRSEIEALKKEMIVDQRRRLDSKLKSNKDESEKEKVTNISNEFKDEIEKYQQAKKKLPKKGTNTREEQTLAYLNRFKTKLQRRDDDDVEEETTKEQVSTSKSYLSHTFLCSEEDKAPVLAKDANMKGEGEWYDLYDPRNKIAQRRAMHGLK